MTSVPEWGSAKPSRLAAVCIGAIRHKVARGLLKKLARSMLASMGGLFDVEVKGLLSAILRWYGHHKSPISRIN
jgi:hypothetical protein